MTHEQAWGLACLLLTTLMPDGCEDERVSALRRVECRDLLLVFVCFTAVLEDVLANLPVSVECLEAHIRQTCLLVADRSSLDL